MRRSIDRYLSRLGLLGVLATSLGALGCPGTLDPSLLMASGSGGTGGAGAVDGGSTCNGDMVVTTSCASVSCHDSTTKQAGLDLTPGAAAAARLIGVKSGGAAGSACGGSSEPYLTAGSNPPTGLLIDKITEKTPPCGTAMPFPGITLLPASTQSCIEQWAEGLIMGTSQ